MAIPYHRSAQYSTRNHFVEPPSVLNRILAPLPGVISTRIQNLVNPATHWKTRRSTQGWKQKIGFRTLVTVPNVFILVWVLVLLWGEKWVFDDSIAACNWKNWEKWPATATPHHLVFVADPQLIDPHTYPGRPWPLSTFTIWHTDNYLYRSYYRLQQSLHPDTLFFLGDLFDGGREWGTLRSSNKDSEQLQQKRPASEKSYVKAWKRYGDTYWLKEYNRFGKIFFKYWNLGGDEPGPGQRGRKIIASLPGNHDLGFGENIQIPTRNRFNAYFGESNRVDVIGNHSFVSIDSVSLSAKQTDTEIYGPVETFLSEVQTHKRKAITREILHQRNESTELIMPYIVENLETANFANRPSILDGQPEYPDFPTILLTHVPLYRKSGEPCGPLRERYPPTPHPRNTPPVNPDERNALPVSAGFQYQTVLGESDSIRLISTIGNVISVFSGDDHDYCEVVHQADKNNVREITVKSVSYAMGVRKPGFLMMSMWNPIDSQGNALDIDGSGRLAPKTRSDTATIQTQLCLLPDQLEIIIRYAYLIGFSVAFIFIKTTLSVCFNIGRGSNHIQGGKDEKESFLPVSNKDVYQYSPKSNHSSTSSTSTADQNGGLAVRSSRARSISPGCGIPLQQISDPYPSYHIPSNTPEKNGRNGWKHDTDHGYEVYSNGKSRSYGRKEKMKVVVLLEEVWRDVWRVTWVVCVVFLWLAKFG